jgi:hypothetical protein
MTTTILAHFDGKQSLVLDQPVDLPVGTPLRVRVEALSLEPSATSANLLTPVIVGLDPAISNAIATADEFAAENM